MARLEDLPMWSAKEVAAYFRISAQSVWDLAQIPFEQGGPPICRIGRIIRFPTTEFLQCAKTVKSFKAVRRENRRRNRRRKNNVLHDYRVRSVADAVDTNVPNTRKL